jgi:hypothetical protein
LRVVLVFVDVMNSDMPVEYVSSLLQKVGLIKIHLCRLSGLGYLCSRSGQKGHT